MHKKYVSFNVYNGSKRLCSAQLNPQLGKRDQHVEIKDVESQQWHSCIQRIADIYGKSVATYCLQGTESQKVLDLRDFVPGVYTYTVSCGKLSQTGKLVIVK